MTLLLAAQHPTESRTLNVGGRAGPPKKVGGEGVRGGPGGGEGVHSPVAPGLIRRRLTAKRNRPTLGPR